jgi:hypothetical protein
MYENGTQRKSYNAISVLLDYDGNDYAVIRQRIHDNKILEKAIGLYSNQFIRKTNYDLIKKILYHDAFFLQKY